jgi:hypothetical protein
MVPRTHKVSLGIPRLRGKFDRPRRFLSRAEHLTYCTQPSVGVMQNGVAGWNLQEGRMMTQWPATPR